jgi:hypothetical protein
MTWLRRIFSRLFICESADLVLLSWIVMRTDYSRCFQGFSELRHHVLHAFLDRNSFSLVEPEKNPRSFLISRIIDFFSLWVRLLALLGFRSVLFLRLLLWNILQRSIQAGFPHWWKIQAQQRMKIQDLENAWSMEFPVQNSITRIHIYRWVFRMWKRLSL